MRFALLGLALLGACASVEAPSRREAFSVEALFADAPAYIASRYAHSELPAALVADMTASGFTCSSAPDVTACGRTHEHTGPSPPCFYSDVIYYYPNGHITAQWDAPRCMGVQPPRRP